ncbi:MAG: hypothetical protein L0287_01815 [Anaerolineae bacterium]|nr:hypothetical protein [Anaerolineae bacterium]
MTAVAIETIGISATAPGTGAAGAAVAGDSLRIRDAGMAGLIAIAGSRQGTSGGALRLTSPLLHDNVVGIRSIFDTGPTTENRLSVMQPLNPQDTLTATVVGSSTVGAVEVSMISVYYENLAGVSANLISDTELERRAVELYQPLLTLAAGSAAGWTGSANLAATENALKANREYAWVGISSVPNTDAAAFGLVSPDWGNLRIAVPILADLNAQTLWHLKQAKRFGLRTIPVLNASQVDNITGTFLQTNNSETPSICLHLVLLSMLGQGKNGSGRKCG